MLAAAYCTARRPDQWSAWVGKTTLGLQFLMAGITMGQPACWFHLKNFLHLLLEMPCNWVGFKRAGKRGLFKIIFTSPRFFWQPQGRRQPPNETLRQLAPQRVVIDSVAHFQRMTDDIPIELREIYNTLVNAMKREGMTSMLLDEAINVLQMQQGGWRRCLFGGHGCFVALCEVDSSMQRAIAVMKMRGSPHQKKSGASKFIRRPESGRTFTVAKDCSQAFPTGRLEPKADNY